MKFCQVIFVASVVSLSTVAATRDVSEYFVDCYRACNEAFVNDLLASGEISQEDLPFLQEVLRKGLEESVNNTANVCVDEEFVLMGDAICFGAENDLCLNDSVKLIHLPPFSADRSQAPEGLLNLIGDRELSPLCIDAFIL